MEFADAARHFDSDPISDGYSGAFLFYGQTSSFDDSHSDGATSRRRVLSLAPGLSMPTRRVVTMYGDRWVVGSGTPDGFFGSVVRQHYSMKRVTDSFAILTPSEALSGAAGTPAYVQKMYFKDVANALTDSEYDTFWNVFVAPGEAVSQGTFFRDADSRLYRVRNEYLPTEGLRVAQTDALDVGARTTAVFATGARDPVTEVVSAGTATVNAIIVDPAKFYRFQAQADPIITKGDVMVFVPSGTSTSVGKTFTMGGLTWRVVAKQTELGALVLHSRLA